MSLGRKIDYRIYIILMDRFLYRSWITNVSFNKPISGLVRDLEQVIQVASISQFIKHDNMVIRILI